MDVADNDPYLVIVLFAGILFIGILFAGVFIKQTQIVLENIAIRLAVFHFGRNGHSRDQPAKDSPDQKACKENGQPRQNDPDPRACHTQITRELFRRRELFH